MTYLISQFWFWFVATFAVGLATAYLTRQEEGRGKVAHWLIWSGLAFGLGLLAALLHVLLGRAGVWLETALVAFATFIAGAFVGVLVRGGRLREHKAWAVGLIPAALLWFGGNIFVTPDLEAGLTRQVGEAVKNAGGDPKNFSIVGRDAQLPDGVPNRDHLLRTIANVVGVRRIEGTNPTVAESPAAPATETVDVRGAADAGKKTVASSGRTDPEKVAQETAGAAANQHSPEAANVAPAATAEAGKTAADKVVAAASQAPDAGAAVRPALTPAERAKAAQATLKALPASGPLEAAACQSALDATQALGKIQFTSGGGGIRRASVAVLNQLAALLQRCPEAKVEVGGHTDNVGGEEENRVLSQRRADVVVGVLTRMGVAAPRLTAVGYGAKKPIASDNDKNGRAENQRIEIILH